jgi:alkanesulfonate monooxygenase SsuD/methylene tetrahydromethanopterin reductase-like flavin-dependent oxidoreductase (luciferase family)
VDFGIFDHCERSSRPAAVTYQERFALAKRAEQAGFYAYHLAEHHGTSLSLVPSPNLFLAALAQHTTTLRLGPLVYLLPLYDSYRLVQEIGMLDNLCNGRMELGVGRGANPIELSFFDLSPASAQEHFDKNFAVLLEAFRTGKVSTVGQGTGLGHGPVDIATVQKPCPPIWYPSAGGSASLAQAASKGCQTIVNGTLDKCADTVAFFRDNFQPGPWGDDPKIGLTRYVYIADTDEEALRVGNEAFKYHLDNLKKLAIQAGLNVDKSPIMPPTDLKDAVAAGWAAAGRPDTVREQLAGMFDKVGNNYFVFAPMMADLSLEWGLRSIELFESEIMPAFKDVGRRANVAAAAE